MSKITYTDKVALNINSDIPDINKCNATDMNEIKEVVNENETKILLAVSSSAPATCETGDMYYNTINDLIYTATGTNTWGSTGVAPTENTIYIVFDSQSAYAYDGNELISVGGGSGDLIMVDPDTPTASTKLYIEESDLSYQGLEIANTYNTSNSMAYSCAYINGTLLWTNPDPTSAFVGQEITLNSSDYDVYEIVYTAARSSDNRNYTSGKIRKGIRYNALFVATVQATPSMVARGMTDITATTMTFGNGYAGTVSSMSSSNDVAVPLYVIGYKTGLFS